MLSSHMFKKLRAVWPLALAAIILVPAAQAQGEAPPKLQAAIIMKILAFYTNLGADDFVIHVVGAPAVAKELQGMVGKPAGKATLKKVTEGGAPDGGAKVVYVGADVASSIAFTQGAKVLSVTGKPSFVADGVTLGIGVEANKPKILLNLSSSKAEGINWAPGILKVAETIK